MNLTEAIQSVQDELSDKTKRLYVMDDYNNRSNSIYLITICPI